MPWRAPKHAPRHVPQYEGVEVLESLLYVSKIDGVAVGAKSTATLKWVTICSTYRNDGIGSMINNYFRTISEIRR